MGKLKCALLAALLAMLMMQPAAAMARGFGADEPGIQAELNLDKELLAPAEIREFAPGGEAIDQALIFETATPVKVPLPQTSWLLLSGLLGLIGLRRKVR